jgi:hypothetical protein
MEKTLSIVIEETRNSIVDIISKSKLHPSIIELMLKGMYLEALMLANEVSQQERETFDGLVKEANNELEESTLE